eukprot:5839510-Amphidinium_carterae.1
MLGNAVAREGLSVATCFLSVCCYARLGDFLTPCIAPSCFGLMPAIGDFELPCVMHLYAHPLLDAAASPHHCLAAPVVRTPKNTPNNKVPQK